jgi:hypothetical protein
MKNRYAEHATAPLGIFSPVPYLAWLGFWVMMGRSISIVLYRHSTSLSRSIEKCTLPFACGIACLCTKTLCSKLIWKQTRGDQRLNFWRRVYKSRQKSSYNGVFSPMRQTCSLMGSTVSNPEKYSKVARGYIRVWWEIIED